MKTRLFLYILLVLGVAAQVVLMMRLSWFPDLVLLMVVFVSIFRRVGESIVFSFVAGFLRGCFSLGTLGVDILLFPAVSALSSMLAKMFYRQNSAAQIFITTIAFAVVLGSHTFYLNVTGDSNIAFSSAVSANWRHMAATIFICPFAYAAVKGLLRLEE